MATHKAVMPRTRVIATFTPIDHFMGYAPDGSLLGSYKKGKTYYIREGNSMLAELCKEWKDKGRITITGD